jgi:hypothetical protein
MVRAIVLMLDSNFHWQAGLREQIKVKTRLLTPELNCTCFIAAKLKENAHRET